MSDLPERDEPEATAEEAALAARLERALERGGRSTDELEPLLEAAHLVRASKSLELAPERQRVIRDELLGGVAERRTRSIRRRFGWTAWLPLPLLAGAAIVWGVRTQQSAHQDAEMVAALATRESSDTPPTDTPPSTVRPSPALLEAQARALRGAVSDTEDRAARAALEQELGQHRQRLVAALEEKLQ